MGITVLAAGDSIPDMLNAIFVAQKGETIDIYKFTGFCMKAVVRLVWSKDKSNI